MDSAEAAALLAWMSARETFHLAVLQELCRKDLRQKLAMEVDSTHQELPPHRSSWLGCRDLRSTSCYPIHPQSVQQGEHGAGS